MKIKTTLISIFLCFYLTISAQFVNSIWCFKKHKDCNYHPSAFANVVESSWSVKAVWTDYLVRCAATLIACNGTCVSFDYVDPNEAKTYRILGCSDDFKNDELLATIYGNEPVHKTESKRELILRMIAECQIKRISFYFNVNDDNNDKTDYFTECCTKDFCNKPFSMNCYLSADVWQSENYKLGEHFPVGLCDRLHFSFGYNILKYRNFLEDSEKFKQHLDKLPVPILMFMEMIQILKSKLSLQTVYFIGTVNNPFNESNLAQQIEEEFQQAIGNDINRQKFANNCVTFMEIFDIHSIDISHPYPNMRALSDFYNRIGLRGHLTLFPTPPQTINLTAKVKEDHEYFKGIEINLFYEFPNMMDFLHAFDQNDGFLRSVTLGTKFMFFSPNVQQQFHFNGTIHELCQKLNKLEKSKDPQDALLLLPQYDRDQNELEENFHYRALVMNNYSLAGLSVIFLDWDSPECFNRRFGALNLIHNLMYPLKGLFTDTYLSFIMDNKKLAEQINKDYDIKTEKYTNFFSTPFKFIVGIITAFLLILTMLLIIFKAFFVENIIYYKELPPIFVEKGYELYSKHFLIIKRIGNGAFSNVYLIKYTGPESVKFDSEQCSLISSLPNKKFAAKVIKICQHGGEIHILREFERMRECTHEFIVKAYGVTLLRRQIAVVMEYLPNGNLLDHLKQLKELPPREIIFSWCRCIIKAMKYLHAKQQPILHRDLAARNCLFIDQEKNQLKIGDFGLARNAQYGPGSDSSHYEASISTSPLAWAWVAKEIVCKDSQKSRMFGHFSFGILLWEICSLGKVPYPVSDPYDRTAIKNWLERQGVPKCPPDAQMIYDNLILPCWLDPPERITFDELEEIIDNGIPLNHAMRRRKTLVLDTNPTTSNSVSMENFTISTTETSIEGNITNSSRRISIASQEPTLLDGIKILPAKKIAFNAPFVYPCCMKITNSGENPICYQLETTNSQRLHMDPTNGILKPNGSVNIFITCEGIEEKLEAVENDCITVEWINKTEEMPDGFQPEWFKDNEMVRRKNLNVKYNM